MDQAVSINVPRLAFCVLKHPTKDKYALFELHNDTEELKHFASYCGVGGPERETATYTYYLLTQRQAQFAKHNGACEVVVNELHENLLEDM